MAGKSYTYLSIIFSMVMLSCQPKEKSENVESSVEDRDVPIEERAERAMHDEIMDTHDEVMPKMDLIMRLKGELNEKLDSIRELSPMPEETIDLLESKISSLEKADQSMMNWMRQWNPPSDSISHAEVMEYFKEQQIAVKEMKNLMLNSIDEANTLLDSMK
ncbi:MAG: hypothetical protein AAFN93_07650 [Bacteroidota bacterium]